MPCLSFDCTYAPSLYVPGRRLQPSSDVSTTYCSLNPLELDVMNVVQWLLPMFSYFSSTRFIILFSQPNQPGNQSNQQPTNHTTTQAVNQPISHPAAQPTSQPATQSTNQPTSHPTSQPTSQPSNQPTKHPWKGRVPKQLVHKSSVRVLCWDNIFILFCYIYNL